MINQAVAPICPYCNKRSERVTGREVYPHKKELLYQIFYQCKPCRAYIGTHKRSDGIPIGRLANKDLRRAKADLHREFDQIWRNGLMSRAGLYIWLAKQLNINKQDCNIASFDLETCVKATELSLKKRQQLSEACK